MSSNTAADRVIDIPPFMTPWDMEEVVQKYLRQVDAEGVDYILDMGNVKNVFSATARLIMRIYDRAERLGSRTVIINACDNVQNALRTLDIDSKIPVYAGNWEFGFVVDSASV